MQPPPERVPDGGQLRSRLPRPARPPPATTTASPGRQPGRSRTRRVTTPPPVPTAREATPPHRRSTNQPRRGQGGYQTSDTRRGHRTPADRTPRRPDTRRPDTRTPGHPDTRTPDRATNGVASIRTSSSPSAQGRGRCRAPRVAIPWAPPRSGLASSPAPRRSAPGVGRPAGFGPSLRPGRLLRATAARRAPPPRRSRR
jgi:hypothetical protein